MYLIVFLTHTYPDRKKVLSLAAGPTQFIVKLTHAYAPSVSTFSLIQGIQIKMTRDVSELLGVPEFTTIDILVTFFIAPALHSREVT